MMRRSSLYPIGKIGHRLVVSFVVVGFALSGLCEVGLAKEPSTRKAQMPVKHAATLKAYCFDCHSADAAEGNVDLESLTYEISRDIPTADLWARILNAINSGEMPPVDADPISNDAKAAFLEDLSHQMVVARKVLSDTGGVITMRRLNRREYANTIKVLTGVRPDTSSLPDDQASADFDTDGASLFFSSDQLEQYLSIARKNLTVALAPVKASKRRVKRIEPEYQFTKQYSEKLAELRGAQERAKAFLAQKQKPATAFGFLDPGHASKQLRGTKEHIPSLQDYFDRPETKNGATLISRIKTGITKVSSGAIHGGRGGKRIIRVRAGAYPEVTPRFLYLECSLRSWTNSYTRPVVWRKITAPVDDPEIVEFEVTVPAGEKVQFDVHQRTHQGRGDKNLFAVHRQENGIGTRPGLWVDWMEVITPSESGGLSPEASAILFQRAKSLDDEQYAREVIRRFATKAFRTEVPDEDYIDRLLKRYQIKRTAGATFNEAIIEPLAIILASPSFLYMVESRGGNQQLTEQELAVRLSYFLWSAPPDEALMQVANSGRLSKPDELRRQTSRLLADKRGDRFVRGFVHQWLGMERLGMFQFQARLYPDFDNGARESARVEIYETIHNMLDQKLALRKLLDGDHVVINDLLGDYYGVEGVEGHEFRRVSLSSDSERGGLLGSAAFLAMGSDGVRTSPVERGAWVLRHLLNDPPPPAPPNVPQLSRLDGGKHSSRDLQIAHQVEPQCAQCHRKIDPIGFGLENFDAAGRWRDIEVVRSGKRFASREEFPIDPSGTLADGREFENFRQLRAAVAERIDDFARGLTENLIEYGLGRPYGFTDQPLADQILAESKRRDYELSTFIHALVQSKAFQSK